MDKIAKCKECDALLSYRTNASNLLAHATKHDKYRTEVEKLRREKLEITKQSRRAPSRAPFLRKSTTNFELLSNDTIVEHEEIVDKSTADVSDNTQSILVDMWANCRRICKEECKSF